MYGVSWVDRTLADLSKVAGTPLPAPLRAFGRRILEFPTHYHDLHAKARASHLSRGALKAGSAGAAWSRRTRTCAGSE